MHTRQKWRRMILSKRRQLTISAQNHAAKQIFKQLAAEPIFIRAQHIAFYLPINGEINLWPLIHHALKMKKNCYLPVLHPLKHNRLLFRIYQKKISLCTNRFGILEPKHGQTILPWALDLVFVPLVGFDGSGNRLGMGKGFYDRTFAFLKHRNISHPQLIGAGYEFQKIDQLKPEVWDVPLDKVVTEERMYSF